MDVRLVQLLGSFIAARGEYALARLEWTMRADDVPAPPVIDRLSDASEATLRNEWPAVERQLDAALAYAKLLGKTPSKVRGRDVQYRALERSVRELDQYARAIRWVLAVTENEDA